MTYNECTIIKYRYQTYSMMSLITNEICTLPKKDDWGHLEKVISIMMQRAYVKNVE